MHASVIIIMIQLYIKKGVKKKQKGTDKKLWVVTKTGKEKKIGGMQSSPVTPDS